MSESCVVSNNTRQTTRSKQLMLRTLMLVLARWRSLDFHEVFKQPPLAV